MVYYDHLPDGSTYLLNIIDLLIHLIFEFESIILLQSNKFNMSNNAKDQPPLVGCGDHGYDYNGNCYCSNDTYGSNCQFSIYYFYMNEISHVLLLLFCFFFGFAIETIVLWFLQLMKPKKNEHMLITGHRIFNRK